MMVLDEKIHIENHNCDWKNDFMNEVQKLKDTPTLSMLYYEHIGSTSIPDIKAKPIIDIIVGVKQYPPNESIIRSLEENGYVYMREMSVPNRLYFIKRGIKNYNIHIIAYRGTVWNDDLLFRDYLLNHSADAQRYSCLKERILNSGVETLLEYSKRKEKFIEEICKKMKCELE